jgi:hypothetical protein
MSLALAGGGGDREGPGDELEALRFTLKRLLTARFGPLPRHLEGKIDQVTDRDRLKQLFDHLLQAQRLEDLGL